MGTESLEARPTLVSACPAPQLFADVMNLFPQKPRRAITTARLQLHDWRRDLDHARIEIDCAAGGELERATGPRKHFAANESLRGPENFLRFLTNVVDDEAEF